MFFSSPYQHPCMKNSLRVVAFCARSILITPLQLPFLLINQRRTSVSTPIHHNPFISNSARLEFNESIASLRNDHNSKFPPARVWWAFCNPHKRHIPSYHLLSSSHSISYSYDRNILDSLNLPLLQVQRSSPLQGSLSRPKSIASAAPK